MNDRYYYRDLQEIIYQMICLTDQIDDITEGLLEAGKGLSGFSGSAAEAERKRFSEQYERLKQKQEDSRKYTYQMLEVGLGSFLAVENSEDAVIFQSRLFENERFIRKKFEELEEEFRSYNRTINGIIDPGIQMGNAPLQLLDEEMETLLYFTKDLGWRLEDADEITTRHLRKCFEGYEDLLAELLVMFDVKVQIQLVKEMSVLLPSETMKKVEDNLEIKILEIHFIEYAGSKEKLMKEQGLRTEEEYQEFLKKQLTVLRIWKEMESEITSFENLDVTERIRLYLNEGKNPIGDFIFMAQLEGYTVEQRKELLKELRVNGKLSPEAFERILGKKPGFWSAEIAGIEVLYKGSRVNMDWADMRMESARQDSNRTAQFLNLLMLVIPSAAKSIKEITNPKYNTDNLDPSVRLDAMERDAISGEVNSWAFQIPKPGDPGFVGPLPDEGPGKNPKTNIEAEIPRSADEWMDDFKAKYGDDTVEIKEWNLKDIKAKYSGELKQVNNPDIGADKLAERIGGQPRVRFENDPTFREFDAISEEYIAQAKPALSSANPAVKDQMKATFEAAIATDKKVYYQFEGPPVQSVIDKLLEYSERYGIEVIIDTTPLGN